MCNSSSQEFGSGSPECLLQILLLQHLLLLLLQSGTNSRSKDSISPSSLQVISNVSSSFPSYLLHLSQSLGNHTDSQPRWKRQGEKGFLGDTSEMSLYISSTPVVVKSKYRWKQKYRKRFCAEPKKDAVQVDNRGSNERERNEAVSNGNYTAWQG